MMPPDARMLEFNIKIRLLYTGVDRLHASIRESDAIYIAQNSQASSHKIQLAKGIIHS
jgi:hypothetical protein